MNYITTKEAVKISGITDIMLVYHCSAERIKGAEEMGNTWLILADTEKPAERPYRSSKVKDGENK